MGKKLCTFPTKSLKQEKQEKIEIVNFSVIPLLSYKDKHVDLGGKVWSMSDVVCHKCLYGMAYSAKTSP